MFGSFSMFVDVEGYEVVDIPNPVEDSFFVEVRLFVR